MKGDDCKTVRQLLAWTYANLARAHAAIEDGAIKYSRQHHIIRNRIYHGLMTSNVKMRTLFDDERIKLKSPQVCSYCGSRDSLAIDHLIPKVRGGPDNADNLVLACRACNCSKSGDDLMVWMKKRGNFPPLLVLRRYLKLAWKLCEAEGLLDELLTEQRVQDLPVALHCLSTSFPALTQLRLSALAKDHEPE